MIKVHKLRQAQNSFKGEVINTTQAAIRDGRRKREIPLLGGALLHGLLGRSGAVPVVKALAKGRKS